MKLAVNLLLSVGMLALCVWLVWPKDVDAVTDAFHAVRWLPYLPIYLGLQLVVHICRSVRWNNLLAPLGTKVATGPLLAISSVGFMAILALPVRLGEFVRPGLIRKYGVSATGALGTVAVERIVDGLVISLLVFVCFFLKRGPDAPGWMMPTAYTALGVFGAALVFLVFAMWRAKPTVRFCMKLTLLPRFAPRIATVIEEKLLEMISGLGVLKDTRNMVVFLAWSAVYWTANGLGVWVLARAFDLDLSVIGGMATMGLVGIGISLPNSPGLVGQFQWFTLLGLSVYLGPAVFPRVTFISYAVPDLAATCLAYAITQHLLQVAWYCLAGALGLLSPWVSLADLRVARGKLAPPAGPTDPVDRAEADDLTAPVPRAPALAGGDGERAV